MLNYAQVDAKSRAILGQPDVDLERDKFEQVG